MHKIIGTEQLSSCDWGRTKKNNVLEAINIAVKKNKWKYVDTAAVYDLGKVESIIGSNSEIFSNVKILSKIGFKWKKRGSKRAETFIKISERDIINQAEESLERLKRKNIDTYFLHRLDKSISLNKQIEFLLKLKKKGYCNRIGLCNLNIKDLLKEDLKLVDFFQTEMSLVCNNSKLFTKLGKKRTLFHSCLARGLITNKIIYHTPTFEKKNDRRKFLKEYQKKI